MDCIEFLERSNIESPPITCIPKVGISLDWPFFKSELYPDIYFSPVLIISMFLKPILGIHVIGGDSMLERSKNSMQSIIENRTYPFEIICNR